MNFAGGGVYTYFKFSDIQHQPCKDHESMNQNSRYSKLPANGHCVQETADNSDGVPVNIV